LAVAATLLLASSPAAAQELEPRAYANAPVGLSFVLVGYDFSEGGIATDPGLPVEDADFQFQGLVLGYAYSFGVAGKSAKIALAVPSGRISGAGTLAGDRHVREVSGLADPRIRFSLNLLGAPALTPREFAMYRQSWILGASVQVGAPLGQYDEDRVVNLGLNRWSIKPELGMSKMVGSWIFELSASGTFVTDNDDYATFSTRAQDPIYAMQVHVLHTFKTRIWLAIDGTYYEGGATTVGGAPATPDLNGSRLGLTLSVPIGVKSSVKLDWNSGLSVRTAADYDAVGVTWQYLWGGAPP